MLILVIGGSASGKSEFAETIAVKLDKKKLYIATMKPFDEECDKRIEKHQIMRKDKGFDNVEIHHNLEKFHFSSDYNVVLLECLSNLLANEMYGSDKENVIADILDGISNINKSSKNTIVVSNDIFFDGAHYSKETLEYMNNLALLNAEIVKKADIVIEIVSGIPIYHKGETV